MQAGRRPAANPACAFTSPPVKRTLCVQTC